MRKKIKAISDLPIEFNLSKYDEVKKYDFTEWYEQLILRKEIFSDSCWRDKLTQEKRVQNYYGMLKGILLNPLVDLNNESVLSKYFHTAAFSVKNLKENKSTPSLGVKQLTAHDLLHIKQSVLPYKKHLLDEIEPDNYPGNLTKLTIPVSEICQSSIADGAVIVNLHLPDKVLEKHFQELVQKLRKNMNIKSKISYKAPELSKWVRYNILPYMDLKILEKIADISIPYHLINNILFPNDILSDETIRKTVEDTAIIALSDETLDMLVDLSLANCSTDKQSGRKS